MSANVAHRRGSVVNDTCYRCGQRVYLLERHLSSTGQLFHRHCYRDSERTATLQRVSSRRSRASVKENLLPPSQPEVASTTPRKSSTSRAKNVEPAAVTTSAERHTVHGRREYAAKVPEVKIPKVTGAVKGSEVTQKNPPASTTVTPAAYLASAANTPKSTDNGVNSAMQKQLDHSSKHSNIPKIISPGTACLAGRFALEDRNAAIAKPQITVSAAETRTGVSSINGIALVTGQCAAVDDDKTRTNDPSFGAAVAHQSQHADAVSVSTLVVYRARPALASARFPVAGAAKTSSPVALDQTANLSSPSTTLSLADVNGVDRPCNVIPGTEPAQPVLRAPASHVDEERMNSVRSDTSQKSNDRSVLTATINKPLSSPSCSINDRTSTLESSSDRSSLSCDVSSLLSPRLSGSRASATTAPVSPRSEVSSNVVKMAIEPRRSETFKTFTSVCSSYSETTRSPPQFRSSAKKQNGLSTKTRYIYRPRSMMNLVDSSDDWKEHRTSYMLRDDDTEVPPVNEGETTSESSVKSSTRPHGDGVYSDIERLGGGETDRPKYTHDSLFTSSKSCVDDKRKSCEAHQNAAKFRNEPIVKGLLENLQNARRQKLQESDLVKAKGKDMVTDERAPGSSRPAICQRGEQLPQQAAVKRDPTSPITNHSLDSYSLSTSILNVGSGRTSKQNEYVSLTVRRDDGRGIAPKVDDVAAESVGTKKYVTKLQAELQRRRIVRVGQPNSSCSEHEPRLRSFESSTQVCAASVESSPPLIAGNCNLSSRFSKSCDDLSRITSTTAAGGEQLTDWQVEAERRRAARGGRYVDPEKLRPAVTFRASEHHQRFQSHTPSRMTAGKTNNMHKSMFELNTDIISGTADRDITVPGNPHVSSPNRIKKRSDLSASVDNLATCHRVEEFSGSGLPRGLVTQPKPDKGRKPGSIGTSSYAVSRECPSDARRSVITTSIPMSPNSVPENHYESINDLQQSPVAERSNAYQVSDFLITMAASGIY